MTPLLRPWLSRLSPAFVLSLCLLMAACGGDLDPEDPEDAYALFHQALFDGDAEGVWERSDETTRNYFQQRYEALEHMNELIERYLPPTDHQLARAQSGAELTDELDDGRELFIHIFDGLAVDDQAAIQFGASAAQVQMAEEGDTARLITRSDQEFDLVRQDDQWFVNFVDSDAFDDRAMQWLDANEEALTQTVEDLIEEERRERESIIAELLQPDP